MINIYVIETMKVENEKGEIEIHGINPQAEILKDELEDDIYKQCGEEVFYYDVNEGLSKKDEERLHTLLEKTSRIETKEFFQEPKSLDEKVTWAHVKNDDSFYSEKAYKNYLESWAGPDEQGEDEEYDEEYDREEEICHGTAKDYLNDTDRTKTRCITEKKRVAEKIYTRQICTVGKDIPEQIGEYKCRKLDKKDSPVLKIFCMDHSDSWLKMYIYDWRVADEIASRTTEDQYKGLSQEEKKAKMEKIAKEIVNDIAAKTGENNYLSLRTDLIMKALQNQDNMKKLAEMVKDQKSQSEEKESTEEEEIAPARER